MFRKRNLQPKLFGFGLVCIVFLLAISLSLTAKKNRTYLPPSGNYGNVPDTLPYPIYDRKGDVISDNKRSTYDFQTPGNISDSVAYDFRTRLYTVFEKIGDKYYRTPTTYTFDEYWQLRGRQSEQDYFKKRANTMNLLNRKLTRPRLSLSDNLFNLFFGFIIWDISLNVI